MSAYSRLKRLLDQRHLSVPELHRRLRRQGLQVNLKSLYRLADDQQPVERLDLRIAGAICQMVSVSLSDWIVFEEETSSLYRLSSEQQARLDALVARNNAGSLDAGEREEFHALVHTAEEMTLANARLLSRQRERLAPVEPDLADVPAS